MKRLANYEYIDLVSISTITRQQMCQKAHVKHMGDYQIYYYHVAFLFYYY